ncbi:hypothetical protein [Achromobacter dolens]|uniref:hypothetical protein n=1 Tax=Achromobacter dolens TaxID=1287738 RepID=UPI00300C71F5
MLLHDEPRGLAALVRMAQVLLDLAQGPQFSNAALDVAADDQRAGVASPVRSGAAPRPYIYSLVSSRMAAQRSAALTFRACLLDEAQIVACRAGRVMRDRGPLLSSIAFRTPTRTRGSHDSVRVPMHLDRDRNDVAHAIRRDSVRMQDG